MIIFWGLGSDAYNVAATAPNVSHARNDCNSHSTVIVHGQSTTPGSLVWQTAGQEEHQGRVLLSFPVSVFRSQGKQTREPTSTAGSTNRLIIEARRQERHPVFFEQMGEQEVGSEGNGKSRGKKSGKAMDVLRKLWCTQGQNTHTCCGRKPSQSIWYP